MPSSSARKFGGKPEDYLACTISLMPPSKLVPDFRHRALRHHTFGIFEAERVFGAAITNSDGKAVPVRWIGEQHVREDCGGIIPTPADWLQSIAHQPWMTKPGKMVGDPSTDPPVTRAMLELSTAHVCRETAEMLETSDGGLPFGIRRDAYSWFLGVPEPAMEAVTVLPSDLVACFALARSLGCDFILFDADADRTSVLEAFEW